jgi:hypothetical protein
LVPILFKIEIRINRTYGDGHGVRVVVVVVVVMLYRLRIKIVIPSKCHSSIVSFVQAGWIVERLVLLFLFCLVT